MKITNFVYIFYDKAFKYSYLSGVCNEFVSFSRFYVFWYCFIGNVNAYCFKALAERSAKEFKQEHEINSNVTKMNKS